MSESKRIKTALVSVYHKDGLDAIIRRLAEEGVEFLSTGGTRHFIESLGYACHAVEDLTGYPSILGGRVKTLHPKVFGGILCRRELEEDRQQVTKYEIPEIDLVIVDLYPFEDTVASGADAQSIIEKIDIGGISLIRAAAKNFNDVVIVASKAQYKPKRLPYLLITTRLSSDGSTETIILLSVMQLNSRRHCVMVRILIKKVFFSVTSIRCSNRFMVRKSLIAICLTSTRLSI